MKRTITLTFGWILLAASCFAQNPGNLGIANLTAWFKADALTNGNVSSWTTSFPTGTSAITVTDTDPPYALVTDVLASNVTNYNKTIEFTSNPNSGGTGAALTKFLSTSSNLNLLDNSGNKSKGTLFAGFLVPSASQNDHVMLYNERGNDGIQLRVLNLKGRLAIGKGLGVSSNASRDWTYNLFEPSIISYKGNRSDNTSMNAFS